MGERYRIVLSWRLQIRGRYCRYVGRWLFRGAYYRTRVNAVHACYHSRLVVYYQQQRASRQVKSSAAGVGRYCKRLFPFPVAGRANARAPAVCVRIAREKIHCCASALERRERATHSYCREERVDGCSIVMWLSSFVGGKVGLCSNNSGWSIYFFTVSRILMVMMLIDEDDHALTNSGTRSISTFSLENLLS